MAVEVACYHPGYTFVEKLQTISTKYRGQQESGNMPRNFMRHYYDLACLLDNEIVTSFIGTKEYQLHKKQRFPKADAVIPIHKNEAFLLSNSKTRETYRKNYESTSGLYYQGQPKFEEILERIQQVLPKL